MHQFAKYCRHDMNAKHATEHLPCSVGLIWVVPAIYCWMPSYYDHKCRSNRKKIKKTKELVVARYEATSGHAEEFVILQPQTQKSICTRCITGLASCCSSQNQSYASPSQWPLNVERFPVQQHDILSYFSRSNSQSFIPTLHLL